MLLKVLKNRVIILAFEIMLDHVEDKVLPFSCVQRRKSTKGYTTRCNWAGHDDHLLTKTAHYHIVRKIQKNAPM